MTVPATLLPSVRVAVAGAFLTAGLEALLTAAGFPLVREGEDVLIVDDTGLADPDALADAPALVALGSPQWATLLPELTPGGWAALPADATPEELLAGVLGAGAGRAASRPGGRPGQPGG
jgi:hypothetical protein